MANRPQQDTPRLKILLIDSKRGLMRVDSIAKHVRSARLTERDLVLPILYSPYLDDDQSGGMIVLARPPSGRHRWLH
jgi:hypothetical protein